MKTILEIDVMKEMGVKVEGREGQKTAVKKEVLNGSVEQAKSDAALEEIAGGVGIMPLEHSDNIIRSWWMQPMGKEGIILRWDLVYSENGEYKRRVENVQCGDIFDVAKKYDPEAKKYIP